MNDRLAPLSSRYRGRFAPTPSGPLHLGSLLTALGSYLDARHQGGQWLLRIDDLDTPRCAPGADALILRQLEIHGLLWDEAPRLQSEHLEAYRHHLSELQHAVRVYACRCTRAQLALSSIDGPDGPVYPGTCRTLALPTEGQALRFVVGSGCLAFDDELQGRLERDLACAVGDFVLRRRDGIIGYHLACAVDEHAQAITTVMRGGDLIGASFAQLAVMDALHLPAPRYAHLPLLVDPQGRKLSKQNHAAPLDLARPADNLWQCLQWLGQQPPETLRGVDVDTLLSWALQHWQRRLISPAARLMVEPVG